MDDRSGGSEEGAVDSLDAPAMAPGPGTTSWV